MKRIAKLTTAAAVGLLGTTVVASAQTKTLDTVKQRGSLSCGVNVGLAGFSQPDDKGNWTGLDVDYCKAIAAAVLGDAGKVRYVPTTPRSALPPCSRARSMCSRAIRPGRSRAIPRSA